MEAAAELRRRGAAQQTELEALQEPLARFSPWPFASAEVSQLFFAFHVPCPRADSQIGAWPARLLTVLSDP